MSKVVIIDYGAGNIDSVQKAVKYCGADAIISSDPKELESCSHIILPGVGSFDTAFSSLSETGLIPVIKEQVLDYKIPFLGICVGMQLLASFGDEGAGSEGLDLIPGKVTLISGPAELKLPHVGWNNISFHGDSSIFNGIADNKDFYFVHSYSFKCDKKEHVTATVDYYGDITVAVQKDNIFGVQFHPEKSQKVGAALLKNFIDL